MINYKYMSFYILCILSILFISNVAALQILNNTVTVNKTANVNKDIVIQLKNNESIPFYNLTFRDSSVITMQKIDVLQPGEIKNITATITTNSNFDSIVKILGFYQTQIGQSSQTYNINVSAFQSTPCDLSIIKGDTVVWKSNLQSDIVMSDANTNLPIDGSTMTSGQTFTKTFSSATVFQYYFKISGVRFPQTCIITVLNDGGFVNNPLYDAALNLKVIMSFTHTTINALAPVSNYTLEFFRAQSGSVTIINTGNATAKGISLSGDWFSTFDKNNFDLQPGESIPVTYSMIPQIFKTEDTNKTYNKNLTISGNFETKNIQYTVFVPFSIVSNSVNSSGGQSILDYLRDICLANPTNEFCNLQPRIIVRNGTDANTSSTITVTQAQWDAFNLAYIESNERNSVESNIRKEELSAIRTDISNVTTTISSTDARIAALEAQSKESYVTTKNITIIVLLVLICILSAGVWYYFYKSKLNTKFEQY